MNNTVSLMTWEVEELLQGFEITKNEVNGDCAISANNDEKCEGGYGFEVGTILTTDNKKVGLYFCKECENLTYYVYEDED